MKALEALHSYSPRPTRRGVLQIAALFPIAISTQAATREFPDYPVRDIQSYGVREAKGSVALAAEPITDAGEQRKYFDFDFSTQGFLPVFVILQNDSPDSSVLLRREDVKFGRITPGASTGAGGDVVSLSAGNKNFTAAAMLGGIPLAFAAFGKVAKASEVRQNLIKKELRSQTLSPGQRATGFLYIPIGKERGTREKIGLQVKASRLSPEEQVEVQVVF